MSDHTPTATAFRDFKAGVAPRVRRPTIETIQRLARRRRRRRHGLATSGVVALMVLGAGLLLQGPHPAATPLPSNSATPTASAPTSPDPGPTATESAPASQAPSEQCSTEATVRPSGPIGSDFHAYKVYLLDPVCPGVRVRVLWATYSVTNFQTPGEVQTLYRQGTVYLDRDHSTLTFPMERPPGCWRGYVGYGNVSAPSTINGSQPIFGNANIGSMALNCSTASP
jgi:hypothetical protein